MGAPDFWAATSETMSSAYVFVPADPSIGIDEEQTAKFACYIADLWYYAEGVDTQPVPFTCGPWSLLVDEVSSWAIRHTPRPDGSGVAPGLLRGYRARGVRGASGSGCICVCESVCESGREEAPPVWGGLPGPIGPISGQPISASTLAGLLRSHEWHCGPSL